MNSEGSYVELIGNETNPIALIRSKGYSDILSQYPNLKKLKIVSANW
jgi:erythritol transport system substrate-binding protein